MNRLDKLLAELKGKYCRNNTYTVRFKDGTYQKVSFGEALRLCTQDEKVIDAVTEGETGTTLLRAILNAGKDVSEFSEFGE